MSTSQSSEKELSLLELRSRLPATLFKPTWGEGMFYILRDLCMALSLMVLVYVADSFIDQHIKFRDERLILQTMIWLAYWWFQGFIFTGLWVLAHECGHGSFLPSRKVSDIIGFILHTALWTPYFSWKYTHQLHHRNHGSMEKDEQFIPRTRSQLNVPDKPVAYDIFEDTPIITVFRLIVQQLFGLQVYLALNLSGQPHYPSSTNHYNPYAVIFKSSQRKNVLLSDFGLVLLGYGAYILASRYGFQNLVKYYCIPCIATGCWVTLIVFLHHTDPALPHYRKNAWNYKLGALSTMDRDFLGGIGRFFLHNISDFHIMHHLFPAMPFYHTEEATNILKEELGDKYHHSNQSVFKSLYDNFRECYFVEDEGDIVYYKDRHGKNRVVDAQQG